MDYLHENGDSSYRAKREAMVERQLQMRGICDERVLNAMRSVEREQFVERGLRQYAYYDQPLFIGQEQTISQPYMVALMAERAELKPGDRVLEIGTGSGYSAAVLSLLCAEVFSVERHGELARSAKLRLLRLGYDNVRIRIGNGWNGWEEYAPFDAIIVAAGASEIPQPLLEQLAPGGRMVIPVGLEQSQQRLMLIRRNGREDFSRESLGYVAFVPFVNEEET